MHVGRSSKLAGCAVVIIATGWLMVAHAFAAPTAQEMNKLRSATTALTNAESLYKSGKMAQATAAFGEAQKSLADLADANGLAKQLDPLVKRLNHLRDNMVLDGAKLPAVADELATSAVPGALLGSAGFRPTRSQPVGWRGDWTGRYPGATPPTEWSRRVNGPTTELKYQARKPVAGPPTDAVALEYFTIKDWLVAGPFEARDSATGIDTDFIGGEAGVQPDDGGKAGSAKWKFMRASMETQTSHVHNEGICRNLNTDFVFAFGKFSRDEKHDFKVEGDFTNKVAYAHTYIYSPAACDVQLVNLNWGSAAKAYQERTCLRGKIKEDPI